MADATTRLDRWLFAAPGRESRQLPRVTPFRHEAYVDVYLLEHGKLVVHTTDRYGTGSALSRALDIAERLDATTEAEEQTA